MDIILLLLKFFLGIIQLEKQGKLLFIGHITPKQHHNCVFNELFGVQV